MTTDSSSRRPISMSSANLSEAEVQAVLDVLRSGRLALGPRCVEFEERMRDFVGVRHAVAVSSGTAALHLIVRGLGLGPGDEVLVPSFTFAASVNVLLYEGATPVFVDIEEETFNLSPDDLEKKITDRTRAIMVVDVFGHPAEWTRIEQIARRHDLRLIDDCCEALGAEYRGKKIGRMGDAGAFAFYPNKQITTGEGGMIVTDNDELAGLARSLRNQGRGEMGAWLEHERLGYNYRLDEMSAALGATQLQRLDELLEKRTSVARLYSERLTDTPGLRIPVVRPHVSMSWFVYVVTLAEGLHRDKLMQAMEKRGIPVRGYFTPMHLQPYIRKALDSGKGDLPVTESVAERTVALPFHGGLSEQEVETVVRSLRETMVDTYDD